MLTNGQHSLAELIASLEPSQRAKIIASLSPKEAEILQKEWRFWARPKQLAPPGDWLIWLLMAGRGWGKTQTGAQWFKEQSDHAPNMAIISKTFADGRDTCVEGESGLLSIVPDLDWNRSIGEGRFPGSGCKFKLFSGEKYDIRGPNNYALWMDELAAWKYPQETFDNAMMTCRKGESKTCITTTPRPIALMRWLIKQSFVHTTYGHTDENMSNLSEGFIKTILEPYRGTRLGRQELAGELLEDVVGALWKMQWIDAAMVKVCPALIRIVVAVDPSVATDGQGDACGIIVAGIDKDKHGYILADYTLNSTPLGWAEEAVHAFDFWKADAMVAEANNGGALVEVNIKQVDGAPPVKLVHASRGKQARAEPVSSMYEKGTIHHVGSLPELEKEMTTWVPEEGKSPNRVDALVWALSELKLVKSAYGWA